jgi:glycine oxidase
MTDADVIVLGGGIAGLAAARALAGSGARVVVVERRRVGAEASAAAAGMLAPQSGVAAEEGRYLLDLALRARDHHLRLAPVLEEETGIRVELSRFGLIAVALSEDEEQELGRRFDWQRSQGLEVDVLGPDELREAEPNLSPAIRRALYFSGDRHVDNVRLTRALAAAAVSRGAAIQSGRPVTALLTDAGRVAGVRAGSEVHRAPLVVNAMGAWAGLLSGDPDPPPVEPVRGQMVAFDLAPALVRHAILSARGYLVPRADGRLLAGSTVERAGFDKSVTAGGLKGILEAAIEMVPGLADVPVVASWAGLRPGTPDDLPIIGSGALPGLFHAGGLYRNGILLGPLVGETVAQMALGRPSELDLRAFSPGRFSATR